MKVKESQSSTGRPATLNLVMFGPPGAGKGTQASFISGKYGLLHLSTGELLRQERKSGSEVGRHADELMSRGELVPDEMVRDLVRREVSAAVSAGKGILFDGYPRNLHQLEDLETILRDLSTELGFGISFEVQESRLLERLTARRTCSQCGQPFNLRTKPTKKDGICDKCGGSLVQRKDDQPDVIRKRFRDYHRQCAPLIEELDRRGMLKRIDADKAIDEVRGELIQLLEKGLDEVAVH